MPGRAKKCNYYQQLTRQTFSIFHSPLSKQKSQKGRVSVDCIEKGQMGGRLAAQFHTCGQVQRVSEKAKFSIGGRMDHYRP